MSFLWLIIYSIIKPEHWLNCLMIKGGFSLPVSLDIKNGIHFLHCQPFSAQFP